MEFIPSKTIPISNIQNLALDMSFLIATFLSLWLLYVVISKQTLFIIMYCCKSEVQTLMPLVVQMKVIQIET